MPSSVGPYRIDRELGRGGMGIVYLGHDVRLDRPVAIKVLPDHVAGDRDRLERFEREARTLASLSHPNIAGIYGIEIAGDRRYLVLEYIDGETLDARLARGRLTVNEALAIAGGIAEALEAAHQRGIVHRDLKPGNVMLTADDAVKVLDFGLARAVGAESPEASPDSPTLASPGALPSPTIPGAIMGTAGYMSPEQARGKAVDKRSDIFSFGCVLYEMLTGDRPFSGETVSDAIGAVLHTDPPLDRLPAGTPPHVRQALRRCLARDKAARYRDIGDVLLDLRSEDAAPAAAQPTGRSRGRLAWLTLAFAAGVALMAVPAWLTISSPSAPAPGTVKRFGLAGFSMQDDSFLSLAISPDGSHVVVRGLDDTGRSALLLRAMNGLGFRAVEGSEAGTMPFFSPDGRHLAFMGLGQIMVAPVNAGAPRSVARTTTAFTGGVWTSDDTIVFAGAAEAALYTVKPPGGTVNRIPVALSEGMSTIVVTSALPDGATVLASVRNGARWDVVAISVADGVTRTLVEDGFQPTYAASGHILFQHGYDGPLKAMPFDAARVAVTGPAFAVADISTRSSFHTRNFAIADDGTLVLVPALIHRDDTSGTLVWVDRAGVQEVITTVDRPIDSPVLSHDDTRVAFRTPAPLCDIWVYSLGRGTTTRITSEGDNHGIHWSADDERLATFRRAAVDGRAVWIRSDAGGDTGFMHTEPLDYVGLTAVSPDERYAVLATQEPLTQFDLSLVDARAGTVTPLLASRFNEAFAAFSPDGRYLAYVTNESGADETYVQTFPAADRRIQVSVDGGTEPVWSPDGRTLYYRRENSVFEVPMQTSPRLDAGRPVELFQGSFARGLTNPGFDVAADGRFVMVRTQALDPSRPSVDVRVNWFPELRRLEAASR